MLMFGWPSAGAGVAPRTYSDDRQRAQASGVALARAILKGTDFIRNTPKGERCDTPIHLLAHSMGNWALRGAVQAMRTFVGNNIPPLFDEVLLMAADEDDDTLALTHKMAPLLRGCRRTTVYYNHQDIALKGSDVAMGNPDRLGRSGPKDVAQITKIVPVNVSPVIAWDAPDFTEDDTGHQYYRHNAVVRTDVLQVLQGKLDTDIAGRRKEERYYVLRQQG
jgi:esterase/lipase superfamily enzyme